MTSQMELNNKTPSSEHLPKRRRSSHLSSLELRRMPVDDLLKPSVSEHHEFNPGSTEGQKNNYFLRRTCMNAKFSLRTQMMLTFGSIDAIIILLVAVVCMVVSIFYGSSVKEITYTNFDNLARDIEGTTARYLAENLSPKLIPEDLVNIIHLATQERFVGYPNHPGYDEDELVPFWDVQSQRNKYPIIGKDLPLDWEIESNVNDANYMEHVQDRWSWYTTDISTRTATFYMQGMCDPSVNDPNSHTYYPNCREENNNIETGGLVAPTPHTYQIHRRASDIAPFFKAVFEYHQDLYSLGVYFANGGSGATIFYPHMELNTSNHYTSIGCDWLHETPHPYDSSRSILTDELNCRPDGAAVSSRVYNPMERGWCRDQAINPEKLHVIGPYMAAWPSGLIIVSVGRAIYDKLTSEFIACISIDFTFHSVDQILQDSRLTPSAQVSIIRNDESGTVVASTAWNSSGDTSTVTIDAIDSGVTKDIYQSLLSLVNYGHFAQENNYHLWNATLIRETYDKFVYHDEENGYHVSGYPIPPPPEEYSPLYVPEFFSLVAVPTTEVYKEVDALGDDVDKTVHFLVVLSLSAGLAGLVLLVINIIFVSNILTAPLRHINDVANDLFNKNFGDHQDNINNTNKYRPAKMKSIKNLMENSSSLRLHVMDRNRNHQRSPKSWKKRKCVPRTEINEVVRQFRKMVSTFTSGARAESIKVVGRELKNKFPMESQFKDLYYSRHGNEEQESGAGFKYNFDFGVSSKSLAISSKSLRRLNFGAVARHQNDGSKKSSHNSSQLDSSSHSVSRRNSMDSTDSIEKKKPLTSSLFFWIVTLTVIPFLIVTLGICVIVVSKASHSFTGIIKEAKLSFVGYQRNALVVYVKHRALLASVYMETPIRDLHVMTRYTEWLLFNGIQRVDSFTELVSNIEACKTETFIEECEELINGRVCDCAWDDKRGTCTEYAVDSRYLQKVFYLSESNDNWPNGDRNSTSFPNVSSSPDTTAWWDDLTQLPGFEEGFNASGYGTMYSRVRSVSALPTWQILYNQNMDRRVHLASYIAFEADGTYMGYEGCAYPGHPSRSNFKATLSNARLRPEICPVGKYGYDPRCREWYHTARGLYKKNHTNLYVTPPYDFAGEYYYGQTCTAPMINSATGEHIGQTLVDFVATPLLESFSSRQTPLHEGGFPFLISSGSIVDDTIVGPGFRFDNPQPIGDVVFANDPNCVEDRECKSREQFQAIVDQMKAGNTSTAAFKKRTKDGSLEHIFMAYAPVIARSYSAINSSDFSRGVEESENMIYSVALAETEEGLLRPLDDMEKDLQIEVIIVLVALIVVICIASVFVTYISYRMALSITEPMLYLLELIEHINRLESYCNAPEIDINRRGHSLEVVNVSKTMESLYRVVVNANMAYFAGDLEEAYTVLNDTLEVYRGLRNKKGIGLACNNLGIMMLTVYRTMEATGEENLCGFTKRQIIAMGMRYFHEAIQSGEKAYDAFYDAQGWSPSCLEFMQHLSNRYFNRAMFLLTVKDSHEKPKEIEELGLRDIQIARDMDIEIAEEGTQAGWGVRAVDRQFDVMLSRVRGQLFLKDMGYQDDYEVEEILEEAFQTVKRELNTLETSMLFRDVSPAGRMQQIEMELMKYNTLNGNILTAAQIAIRMLVEDEYILLEAQRKAVEVLLTYVDSSEFQESKAQAQLLKSELLNYQKQLELKADTVVEASATERKLKETMKSIDTSTRSSGRSSSFYRPSFVRESERGDITMETF